jgi:hypothetical protein
MHAGWSFYIALFPEVMDLVGVAGTDKFQRSLILGGRVYR